MLRSCFDNGLLPERTALIGKCYSNSPTALALMEEEGIYICPSSSQFDSHQSYDNQFRKNMSEFFQNVVTRLKIPQHAKLIVLDDGGELISIVNSCATMFRQVIGVEQTSAGYHKLAKLKLNIPIINVARCSLKLIGESPAVSEAQIQHITRAINNLGIVPKRILIAGNGALGKYLTQALRLRYDVVCYDKIPHLSEIHKEDLDVSSFDMIIGATGNRIMTSEHISNLKEGVVLVSASSSDREFDASYFRKKIEKNDNCHEDIFVDGIHLLNCGFPVNFQGADEDSIPLEKIQLTIALMFCSIFKGVVETNSKGLLDLDYPQRSVLYQLSQGQLLQNKLEKLSLLNCS
ncbi:MAG: hypothetical protein K2Y18_00195 [Alphaproteobacteria bacterium]|nr:hypothetical protein [Alphaproteobacteria bacterium]